MLLGSEEISRKMGDAIVSSETFIATRINTCNNGSKERMTSMISIRNESLKIIGEPKISQKIVDQIARPSTGQRSTLAESNNTESEMHLIDEGDWKPSRYVLTCGGVYSNNGLGGIRQKIIVMI